jgi:hypothetical protein
MSIRTLLVSAFGLLLGWAACAAEVKLTAEDFAKVERKGEVVTTGVPFARGALKDVSNLCAKVGGEKIPAQFVKTVPWKDGSVRWALMDTQVDVPAGGKVEITVSDEGAGPAPASPVKVEKGEEEVKVSTGPLEFEVSRKSFNLFKSLKVDGKELLTGKGKGLVLVKAGGGEVLAGAPEKVDLEHAGPMKTILVLKGKFPGTHRDMLHYTVRITAYAGRKYLKVHTWLENAGKYGYTGRAEWLNFDGMRVDLGLGLGGEVTASCEGVEAKGKLTVKQTCGGQHRFSELKFAVTGGGKELKSGARTDGVVALSGADGKLNTAIRHFWQNYEKAIELDGDSLRLWLWPTDGQWPRSVKRGASCGEFGSFRKGGLYALPGGVHKGYEAVLDFSGRPASASAATVSSPLMALAPAAYYAQTEAAVGWFAPAGFASGDEKYDGIVRNWDKMAVNAVDPACKSSLIRAAQGPGERRGFWFGWMDYGDLYWQPGACSLHYDWTWVMMLDYMRTGDRRFLDLGTSMARHRVDVDQIWSDRVAHYFRGLTRYEKGYTDVHGGVKDGHYKAIPSHHWNQGIAVYYMLTGEEKAREAALRSATGVTLRTVDKFRKTPGSRVQLREVGWGILVFCSAYDLTADQKYLDEALVLFRNVVKTKHKESGSPYMDGGLQYYYSVYPFAMLHHRTGDAEVLDLMREGVKKDSFSYKYPEWTIHINNLYAYVGMVEKDQKAIAKAKDLFMRHAPGKPNPGVYNANGAWTKESIKKLRYGHLLQYILWKKKGGG